MTRFHDVAVVGGGLLGASIAWGLARLGGKVVVLDEGDFARQASRANFALVWVQGKGAGLPAYARWTIKSSRQWPMLAEALREQTGLDVHYRRPGGFHICLSAEEVAVRQRLIGRMQAQGASDDHGFELVRRAELAKVLPDIGPDVVGASYSPHDGHVNSLRTLRAFHAGLPDFGADYRPEHTVADRAAAGRRVRPAHRAKARRGCEGRAGCRQWQRAVGPQAGLFAPMRPTRGQIIVTERVRPFLHHPLGTIRQTDEGTVMIGDSKETRWTAARRAWPSRPSWPTAPGAPSRC